MLKVGDIIKDSFREMFGVSDSCYYEITEKFGSSYYIKNLKTGKIDKMEARSIREYFTKVDKEMAKILYGSRK